MCLGLVHGRAHGIIASTFALDRPNLTKLLCNYAQKGVPGFKFTSIQVSEKGAQLGQKLGQLQPSTQLYSHRNAWANLHFLGQRPNSALAPGQQELPVGDALRCPEPGLL
jgi:hypothetical protein